MSEFSLISENEGYGACDDEIGGASLKPVDFMEIVNAANQE